ncbi:MAG: XdhC family protein [Pseudomonadota bacterium]
MTEFYRELIQLLSRGETFATATVVGSTGSIPNEVGAKMLVDANGRLVAGTMGGGDLEFRAL